MSQVSRRDFLKLSASGLVGMGFSPFLPHLGTFDDAQQVRVATKSVSVFSAPNDQSGILMQRYRDELVNIYEEVDTGAPAYNPIWYHVWGGYMHRARLQKVKSLFNQPLMMVRMGMLGIASLTNWLAFLIMFRRFTCDRFHLMSGHRLRQKFRWKINESKSI